MISDFEVLTYCAKFNLYPSSMFSRQTVREVGCPECSANPGEPCRNPRRGPRVSNHVARCYARIRRLIALGN